MSFIKASDGELMKTQHDLEETPPWGEGQGQRVAQQNPTKKQSKRGSGLRSAWEKKDLFHLSHNVLRASPSDDRGEVELDCL